MDRRTAEGRKAWKKYKNTLHDANDPSKADSPIASPSSPEIDSTPSTQVLHDVLVSAVSLEQTFEIQPNIPLINTPDFPLDGSILCSHAHSDGLEGALACASSYGDQPSLEPQDAVNGISQPVSNTIPIPLTISFSNPQPSRKRLPLTAHNPLSEEPSLAINPLPITPAHKIELPARLFRKSQPFTLDLPQIPPRSPVQPSNDADICNVPSHQPITYTFADWTSDSMLLIPPPTAENPIQEPVYQISASLCTNRFLPNCYVTQVRRASGDIVGQFE